MWRPVLAVATAILLVAGCSSDEPADYDSEFHDEFLQRCEDAFGRPEAPQVCGCWYDTVSEAVAFEDLPSIDDLVGDDFDIAPTRLPGGDLDVPLQLLAECVRTVGQQPIIGTAPPMPTLPRPPTTPTTATTVASG